MTAFIGIMTSLFLSPLLFALLLAAGVLLGALGRRRASLLVTGGTTVLLLAFSTGAVSGLLLRPLEYRYPPWRGDETRVDAVVVLGGGMRAGSPDEEGRAALDPTALARVVAGFSLARRIGVPIIVSGGTTWLEAGAGSEADAAARVLERLGLPASMLVREGKSMTTWENAREVSRLLGGGASRRVALVTSAWHMPRAMLAFKRAGITAVPAPTGYLTEGRGLRLSDLVPGFASLQDTFLALREYLGILAYAARR